MDGELPLAPPGPSLLPFVPEPAGERPCVRHEGFDLPARACSVGEARERVTDRLRGWGLPEELEFTAQLVVSEFVTNALVHTASGRIGCRLRVGEHRLRIEVVDEGGRGVEVRPREAEREDVNGRGLRMVGAVAEEWGVHGRGGGGGSTVWAELSLDGLS